MSLTGGAEREVDPGPDPGAETGSDARPFGLSKREAEILGMIATGMSNQEIADSLILSRHTVVRHVANVFAKLDVNNRTEAAAIALEYEIGVEAK